MYPFFFPSTHPSILALQSLQLLSTPCSLSATHSRELCFSDFNHELPDTLFQTHPSVIIILTYDRYLSFLILSLTLWYSNFLYYNYSICYIREDWVFQGTVQANMAVAKGHCAQRLYEMKPGAAVLFDILKPISSRVPWSFQPQ